MTEEELLAQVTHRLRSSLAVIAGYCEIGLTRDDPALRAEAREAVSRALGGLTDGIDEVLLALELAWEPEARDPAAIDLRAAAAQAVARTAGLRDTTVEPGEEVWALADHETAVRALQALLRAAGPGAAVGVAADGDRSTAAIRAAHPVELDDEQLALGNARRLAELQRGSVAVDGARLTLELPSA